MFKAIAFLLCALCAFFEAHANSTVVEWHEWDGAAFERAVAEKKMIMVNVGHEGCTACRFMEENTFSDNAVINFLNENFVNIQVDSEARPDIGERYSDWAWPATAFMLPDTTQVLALRGSLRPQRFLPIIKDIIEQYQAGTLSADASQPYVAPTTPNEQPLASLRRQVHAQLDRSFNDDVGGWGAAKVLEYAEPSLQFMWRAYLYGNSVANARGLKNAYGFAKQLDETWGGVFYASFKRFGNTVKEKRTESQAAALQLFAAAYQLTQDSMFLDRIERIDHYLQSHMRGANGLIYASQKDVVPGMTQLDIDEYYALDDDARRAHGLPLTDHATYSDLNARVLHGYVRAYQATGETRYRERAISIAQALVDHRLSKQQWIVQLTVDKVLEADPRVHVLRATPRPYLRTQAYAGRALLALYQATADTKWLEIASAIAEAMHTQLEDKTLGGFFATTADASAAFINRRKPLEDNAVAAQFLYLLGVAKKDDALKVSAERTIRASATPAIVEREGRITGNLAIAIALLESGYVEFSVVGDNTTATAQQLLNAANGVFEPRKLVHFEKPGRYPERERPALYICNDDACSLPIEDSAKVAAEAVKFRPVAFKQQKVATRP